MRAHISPIELSPPPKKLSCGKGLRRRRKKKFIWGGRRRTIHKMFIPPIPPFEAFPPLMTFGPFPSIVPVPSIPPPQSILLISPPAFLLPPQSRTFSKRRDLRRRKSPAKLLSSSPNSLQFPHPSHTIHPIPSIFAPIPFFHSFSHLPQKCAFPPSSFCLNGGFLCAQVKHTINGRRRRVLLSSPFLWSFGEKCLPGRERQSQSVILSHVGWWFFQPLPLTPTQFPQYSHPSPPTPFIPHSFHKFAPEIYAFPLASMVAFSAQIKQHTINARRTACASFLTFPLGKRGESSQSVILPQ